MQKLILLGIIILFFGCVGGPTEPGVNQTPIDTTSNNTSVTPPNNSNGGFSIISSSNQTSISNQTQPGTSPQGTINTSGYVQSPEDRMGLYFIHVGDDQRHGDSILIQKGNFDMLVDAGPKENAGAVVDFLNSHSVDDIEVLVSTHADIEHYGGIKAVLDSFYVEEFWYSGESYGDVQYENLIDSIRSKDISIRAVKRDDIYNYNGIKFEILNPLKKSSDADNGAVVIRVVNGLDRILLTSDINTGAQRELLNDVGLETDIFMMPYHGLGRGNAQANLLLSEIKPLQVIISGGTNDDAEHGGDRKPLFRILDLNKIPVYVTYNGSIRIISDGEKYTITQLN